MNFSICVKNPSIIREKIGYDITRKYVPAPWTAYANIYVEDKLIGFYIQVEQVDKMFLIMYFQNNTDNLYKASDKGTNLTYLGQNQSSYETGLELKANEDLNDWSDLITLLDQLTNTLTTVFKNAMENYLNLDQCCRLLAFDMVFSNFDSYTGSRSNFYLYDDLFSGQFQMIPWDFNETFGTYTNNWNIFTVDSVNLPNLSQQSLNQRILENESLHQSYVHYINDMMLGPISFDSISAVTDRIKLLIDAYVKADNNKLYSYQNFVNNIESDALVEIGMQIPGTKSFSKRRDENLKMQLARYLETSISDEYCATPYFKLQQNYPNPFNPNTTIIFLLVRDSDAKLEIFNIATAGRHPFC